MKETIKTIFEKHYPLLLFLIYAVPYSWSLIWYTAEPVSLSLVLLLVICILIHIFFLSIKRSKNGQLLSVLYISLFLNLQYVHYFIQDLGEKLSLQFRYPALLALVAIAILTTHLLKSKRSYTLISKVLSYFIMAFSLVSVSARVIEFAAINSKYLQTNSVNKLSKITITPENIDVYYLVFDSYTSHNSLKKYHYFDNSSLKEYLEKKGFKIVENSKSKYTSTTHCLSSVFGMDTLKTTNPWGSETNEASVRNANLSVEKAPLFSVLNHAGIDIYAYSIFPISKSINKKITWGINWWSKIEHIFQGTALKYLYMKYYYDNLTSDQRVEKSFYKNIRNNNNKAFYFYHFYAPHGGYGPTHSLYNKSYPQRVERVNQRIIKLIDTIFKNNKRPFIIVIQGDHGSREIELKNPKNLEKYTILNAVYFPDKDYSKINDNFSPINTFRLILGKYFHANIELLDI